MDHAVTIAPKGRGWSARLVSMKSLPFDYGQDEGIMDELRAIKKWDRLRRLVEQDRRIK